MATTQLAKVAGTIEPLSLADYGKVFAASKLFADATDAAKAIVKMQAGMELGFGPMASMMGIHIIKGKVVMSSLMIAAAVKRGGKYNYRIREHSDRACTIEFFEGGQSVGTSTFTADDAKQAGLLGNANWKAYPRNMLFARAMSNGAKWYAADVFGGPVYTPDEMGAIVDADEQPIGLAEPEPETAKPDAPKERPSLPGDTWADPAQAAQRIMEVGHDYGWTDDDIKAAVKTWLKVNANVERLQDATASQREELYNAMCFQTLEVHSC